MDARAEWKIGVLILFKAGTWDEAARFKFEKSGKKFTTAVYSSRFRDIKEPQSKLLGKYLKSVIKTI